jgi:hypothetical protein
MYLYSVINNQTTMKKEMTLNEKGINFLVKARKQKGVTVIDNSGKNMIGLFHIDAQIWSKNRRTLEDLSLICPVNFDIQKIDKKYMMQLYGTAKAEE